MKEFSNIISVYPIADLATENPKPWDSDVIGTHSFQADDFVLDPTSTITEVGIIFDINKDFPITTPSAAEITCFSYPVKSIVVLRDTSGIKYTIGSPRVPATVYIQKGLQKSRLLLVAKLLESPF
jgi:hypothetical protein